MTTIPGYEFYLYACESNKECGPFQTLEEALDVDLMCTHFGAKTIDSNLYKTLGAPEHTKNMLLSGKFGVWERDNPENRIELIMRPVNDSKQ